MPRGSQSADDITITASWASIFSAATDGFASGCYIRAASDNAGTVTARWKPSKGPSGYSYCTYAPGADLPPIKSSFGIASIEVQGTQDDTITLSVYEANPVE